MTDNKQKNNLLPFEVISEATKGNVDALCTVLRHYDGYICKLCTRRVKEPSGKTSIYVDEEMSNRLKVRLIMRTLAFQIR